MTFNLAVILGESAAAAPGRTVAFFPGGQLTYGELDALSGHIAAALTGKGLGPGDTVALQLPNIPQFLISYFGILKAGCVAVPLNVMLKSAEVEFQLEDSAARALITWEGVLAEAGKGAAAAGLTDIYAVGHPAGTPGAPELLARPDLGRYDVSSLRLAVSGGASISAPLLDAFEERFGVVILESYGLTETTSTTTQNPSAAERRAYSVGKPIWGTQTQVWDAHGHALPPGPNHVGEVVTRGLHVMKGYLNNPEATAAAVTDGWLHTGDLGYIDEDGFLFIVSRTKDLIIRGGYNVYPSEIENVLNAHPAKNSLGKVLKDELAASWGTR